MYKITNEMLLYSTGNSTKWVVILVAQSGPTLL